MSMAVLPRVLDLSLATSVMEPARTTSPSMVVPCCRVKILLPSPVTETEEPLILAPLPAVVVTVARVIGAKKVWPPEMKMADLPVPLPVRLIAPRFTMPELLTILPALVSTATPMAPAVSPLVIEPALLRKLLELMVTAGLAALISTPPDWMVMLPSVVVLMPLFWTPVMVVSARPAVTMKGAASNAAVAAESIRRCFVKIQTSYCWPRTLAVSAQTLDLAPAWLGSAAVNRPGPAPARLCTYPAPPFNSKFSRFNQVLAGFRPISPMKKA